MKEADDSCEYCAKTEHELANAGRQLYVCEKCGTDCCSACSETGGSDGNSVYCVNCVEDGR